MTREDILKALVQGGLAAEAGALLALTASSVRLVTTPADPSGLRLGASRIGGIPDIPAECVWPTWQKDPMAFIAQIDLAEIAGLPECSVLPPAGHLVFFYDARQRTWGFDPKHRGSSQVVFVPPGARIARRTAPHTLSDQGRFDACSVSYESRLTLPSWDSAALTALGLSEEKTEKYCAILDRVREGEGLSRASQVLGHPAPVQGDMQVGCAIVAGGLFAGDESGWNDPRRPALELEAPRWKLLLQVDSEPDASMMWGDMGRIYWWIHEDDLRNRRFDRSWLILQCS